jgi:hypothetical protein
MGLTTDEQGMKNGRFFAEKWEKLQHVGQHVATIFQDFSGL